jgi:membrane protein implicated in regulation of membrane protease activity
MLNRRPDREFLVASHFVLYMNILAAILAFALSQFALGIWCAAISVFLFVGLFLYGAATALKYRDQKTSKNYWRKSAHWYGTRGGK